MRLFINLNKDVETSSPCAINFSFKFLKKNIFDEVPHIKHDFPAGFNFLQFINQTTLEIFGSIIHLLLANSTDLPQTDHGFYYKTLCHRNSQTSYIF